MLFKFRASSLMQTGGCAEIDVIKAEFNPFYIFVWLMSAFDSTLSPDTALAGYVERNARKHLRRVWKLVTYIHFAIHCPRRRLHYMSASKILQDFLLCISERMNMFSVFILPMNTSNSIACVRSPEFAICANFLQICSFRHRRMDGEDFVLYLRSMNIRTYKLPIKTRILRQ